MKTIQPTLNTQKKMELHQIWYQGEGSIPRLPFHYKRINERHCERSCWMYRFWDAKSIEALIVKHFPQYFRRYKALPYLHQRVDVAKLFILLRHGGIYMDMDSYVYNGSKLNDIVSEFTSSPHTCMLSINMLRCILNVFICHGTTPNVLNNGIILSQPGCIFLQYWLDKVLTMECLETYWLEPKAFCINRTTGPYHLTGLYNLAPESVKNAVWVIKQPEYFEPYFLDRYNITDNTVIVHHHQSSWIGTAIKSILKHLYLNHVLLLLVHLTVIVLFYCGLLF